MKARGEQNQLLEIFQPAGGVFSLAGAQLGAIAGGVEQQGNLVGERMAAIGANAPDESEEGAP